MGTQSLEEGYCWVGLLSILLGCVLKSLMQFLEKLEPVAVKGMPCSSGEEALLG